MTHKIADLAVKTGEYKKDGEIKARYENVGSLMQGDKGHFLILKRTFNPAGVPNPDDKDSVIVSCFEQQNNNQQAPQQQQQQQPQQAPQQQPQYQQPQQPQQAPQQQPQTLEQYNQQAPQPAQGQEFPEDSIPF